MPSKNKKPANALFKEAFERLKNNSPVKLPPGTPVTQNNVAREAGRDPSALRASRYPELLQEIQAYILSKNEEKKHNEPSSKNRARKIEKRLADCRRERDKLLSICHSQQSLIDDLMADIDRLEKGKVVEFRTEEH